MIGTMMGTGTTIDATENAQRDVYPLSDWAQQYGAQLAPGVELTTNDPDEGSSAFSITGTVVDPARPEIAIYRDWEAVEQTDGSTFVFPQTPAGTPVSRRFRVENLGDGALDIASAQVAGTYWSLIETPASSVAPGGSTHFIVDVSGYWR